MSVNFNHKHWNKHYRQLCRLIHRHWCLQQAIFPILECTCNVPCSHKESRAIPLFVNALVFCRKQILLSPNHCRKNRIKTTQLLKIFHIKQKHTHNTGLGEISHCNVHFWCIDYISIIKNRTNLEQRLWDT